MINLSAIPTLIENDASQFGRSPAFSDSFREIASLFHRQGWRLSNECLGKIFSEGLLQWFVYRITSSDNQGNGVLINKSNEDSTLIPIELIILLNKFKNISKQTRQKHFRVDSPEYVRDKFGLLFKKIKCIKGLAALGAEYQRIRVIEEQLVQRGDNQALAITINVLGSHIKTIIYHWVVAYIEAAIEHCNERNLSRLDDIDDIFIDAYTPVQRPPLEIEQALESIYKQGLLGLPALDFYQFEKLDLRQVALSPSRELISDEELDDIYLDIHERFHIPELVLDGFNEEVLLRQRNTSLSPSLVADDASFNRIENNSPSPELNTPLEIFDDGVSELVSNFTPPPASLVTRCCTGVLAGLSGVNLIVGLLAVASVITAIAPPVGIIMAASGGIGLALSYRFFKASSERDDSSITVRTLTVE